MAPKGKSKNDDLKQEEILQAVVIADSFNVRFAPATDKKPRALLPLVNVPMLDYTLDYLASEGVQETLVFCCHHADQIRAHLRDSKWGDGKSSMSVKTILSEGCRSVGDVLREVDSRSMIRSDFFLLSCDTISSVNLKALMKDHKEGRDKIKSCVMTATYMKTSPLDRMRCVEDNVFLAVDPTTQRICYYQTQSLDTRVKVPVEVFVTYGDVLLHQDLLDSQLYVCSPSVLHLFTDNFDYCSVEDFIKGILINEEILGNTIHVNVLRNKYCARITNPYMYGIISQDIIRCRTQPINPCLKIGHRTETISCRRPNIYQSADVTIASGVNLKQNVVIGKGTTIQGQTEISDSVIGHNCRIGAKVTMEGCYVWDNVTIEDGCELRNSIICGNVTVYAKTTVQPRSILGWDVKVGPDVTLEANLRLQDAPCKDEFADESEEEVIPEVTPEYGTKSRAFACSQDAGSDDDESDPFSGDWGDPLVPKDRGDIEDDDSAPGSDLEDDEDSGEEIEEDDDFGMFYSEFLDTLKRAKEEHIKTENVILEVNSLKHAYNIAIGDVHQAVIKVLVDVPLKENANAPDKALLAAVLRHLETYKELLTHYINKMEPQIDCLNSLEDFALENERVLSILPKVVHYLYNADIVEEPAIMQWYRTPPVEDEEEEHAKVRRQMKAFVTWLQEAEEESEEESD
ncbi:translation initiation factor eIF2B subunit epsilon-like [Littorina saxatilis]|uniref:Translation initiation factor eIF2B subunit epsilon n=1 Tax=Littorina saxatilis TaxID=31220 RepID=A0AAN9B136_9CAEN